MRKVTEKVVGAFVRGERKAVGATTTDGNMLLLHGNLIARRVNGDIEITNAGWATNTTKERLNAIPGVSIHQSNFQWFLNGIKWDGSWIKLSSLNK